jgi:hypothetical protein
MIQKCDTVPLGNSIDLCRTIEKKVWQIQYIGKTKQKNAKPLMTMQQGRGCPICAHWDPNIFSGNVQ